MFSDYFQFSRHGIPLTGLIPPHIVPVQSQVVDIQRDIYRDLNFSSHVDAAKYQQYLHMKYTVRS